jgi:hypothetical protein
MFLIPEGWHWCQKGEPDVRASPSGWGSPHVPPLPKKMGKDETLCSFVAASGVEGQHIGDSPKAFQYCSS